MQNNRKVFLSFFAIVFAFLLTWFLVSNIQKDKKNPISNNDYSSVKSINSAQISDLFGGQKSADSLSDIKSKYDYSKNFTAQIAKDVASDLNTNWKSGKIPTEDDVKNILKKSDNITSLMKAAENIQKPIEEERIVFTKEDSTKTQKEYYDQVFEIISNASKSINEGKALEAVKDVFENNNFNQAKEYLDEFKEVVDSLYSTSVPSSQLTVHKKAIVIFNNMVTFYESMIDYENDPIKFMAVSQQLPKLAADGKSFTELIRNRSILLGSY